MNLKKLYNKEKKEGSTIVRFLNIPVYRCFFENRYRKKYFFGVLFSNKIPVQKKISKDEHNNFYDLKDLIEKNSAEFAAFEKNFMNFSAVEMCSDDREKDAEKNAIFLAGSMAIVEYTVRIHSCQPDAFDIFADVSNFEQWNHLRSLHKNAHKIIFPLSSFETVSKIRKYKNKIFVLGDSNHHKEVLKMAIRTKGEANRWLILHEAYLYNLFSSARYNDLKRSFTRYYPQIEKELSKGTVNDCMRLLLELTGIKNIILYSKKAKEKLQSNLMENDEVKAFALPLPFQKNIIQNSDVFKFDFKASEPLIGTFGIPNDFFKRTRLLIEAVHLLNRKKDVKVKLLIAGDSVDVYEKSVPDTLKQNVVFLSNVSSEDWLSLCNSVDFAVQLRENAFSYSSACISELLAIGKRVVVTNGMVDPEWEKAGYVRFVKEGLNAEEMAEILKDEIQNKRVPEESDEIYQAYSFENNCAKIKSILDGDI